MKPLAADLVATELREALTAHGRAVSGPSATAEAEARERLELAAHAAAALLDLTAPPRPTGLGRRLSDGQPVLWLDISTGKCGIRHGQVIAEVRAPGLKSGPHYDIAIATPWGENTELAVSTDYLIPVTSNSRKHPS